MATACKLLSFATVTLAVSPYCVIHGCEVCRSDVPKGCHETKCCMFLGAVEGQMAKFVAETLRVCRGLVLLMHWT